MDTARRYNPDHGSPTARIHPQHLTSFAKVRKLVRDGVDFNEAVDEDGHSLFQIAIMQGCCKGIVKHLVSNGADVNFTNCKGATALHLCCLHGKPIALMFLLHLKSNVDVQDHAGCTPLHIACRVGCLKMINLLLDSNASIKKKNNEGNTPIHEACLTDGKDVFKIVEKLISHDNTAVDETNEKGELPLHIACREQRKQTVSLLTKVNGNNEIDNQGQTYLHHAVVNKYPDFNRIMTLLVQNGEDVTVKDNNGETAFEKGLQLNTVKMFKFLDGAAVHLKSYHWEEITCVRFDEMFKEIKKDTSILSGKTQDLKGNTLLHHINSARESKLVNFILVSVVVDVNIQNNEGESSLHVAAKEDYGNVFSELLNKGGHVTLSDHYNRVPFLIALENNNKKVLYMSFEQQSIEITSFLESNPSLIPVALQPNKAGKNLLHYACRSNCFALVKLLLGKEDFTRLLSHKGKNSALHKAARGPKILPRYLYFINRPGPNTTNRGSAGQTTKLIIDVLLDHGFKLNAENAKGLTPLAVAFVAPNNSAFRYLLSIACQHKLGRTETFGKLDINVRNCFGDTPLLLACKVGCTTKEIQILLQMGANCHSTFYVLPKRPVLVAEEQRSMTTVELLLAHGDNYRRPRNQNSDSSKMSTDTCISAFYSNVEEHNFEGLQKLLKSNVNIHTMANSHDSSLLHVAVKNCHFIHTLSVACLIEHGADVNAVNTLKLNACETILNNAMSKPLSMYQLGALRLLTSAGSTMNISKFKPSQLFKLNLLPEVDVLEFVHCLMLLGAKQSNIHENLTSKFRDLFSHPLTLQQRCAVVLRQRIKPNTWVGLKKITLPEALKLYVMCGYRMTSLLSTDITFQI